MTVLVLNCGSSSIKYQLLDPDSGARSAQGLVDRVGLGEATRSHTTGGVTTEDAVVAPTHVEGMAAVVEAFATHGPGLGDLRVIGHRAVMGGAEFTEPTVIDDGMLAVVERLSPLAPLHNPANLIGIRVARDQFPGLPHVAVFDTAFFASMPPEATTYAIDREVAERYGIRRYGFHGTSHRYVSGRVAELLGRDDLRQVVLHLGNGASASAVVAGRPVATTMGLTPLEGLVMGTRSGDIDPAIVMFLQREAGMSVDEVDTLLNRRSGLLGLGGSNDLRDIHASIAAGDTAAALALDVYVRRIRHYVGGYAAIMGGIDALAFTAGVGENDAVVRRRVVDGLGFFGLAIDEGRNERGEVVISPDDAPNAVLVVPTDEELAIARAAIRAIG